MPVGRSCARAAASIAPRIGGVFVQLLHRVDLRLEFAAPGERLARRLRVTFDRALAIDEVELEFDRHDRPQAQAP